MEKTARRENTDEIVCKSQRRQSKEERRTASRDSPVKTKIAQTGQAMKIFSQFFNNAKRRDKRLEAPCYVITAFLPL